MRTKRRKFLLSQLYAVAPPVCRTILRRYEFKLLPSALIDCPPTHFTMKDRHGGFFGIFFDVIGALDYCLAGGHRMDMDFSEGYYVSQENGGNWWDYFFEPSSFFADRSTQGKGVIEGDDALFRFCIHGRDMPISYAAYIMRKAGLKVKRTLLDRIDAFVSDNFASKNTIGIHFRGTDKVDGERRESTRVAYEFVFDQIERVSKDATLFIATDEEAFLDAAKSKFGKRIVSYESVRSTNGKPVHDPNNGIDMGRIGEDALVDCLLLSRSNLLMRTDSNLSHASRYFNPRLKEINITERMLKAGN